MALRAGYYGVKRFLRNKLETIAGTYDKTIKSLFPRSEQAVLGAYNVARNDMVNHTKNGVTFNVDTDGVITLSGICTGDISVGNDNGTIGSVKDLPLGKYKLVGCPSGGSGSTYRLVVSNSAGTAWITDFGDGIEFELTSGHTWDKLYIRANSGVDLTGKIFKPMITTDLNATYDDFVPYAMTNRELTVSAADQKTAINAIITAATGAADFAAFKTAMGAITPVTRSLSLTREDITDEVKEAEPEKTVTKKRTTKKTEEV